jgi:hypothetical protein
MVFDAKVQKAARDCLIPVCCCRTGNRMIQIDKTATVETRRHAEIDRHKLIALLRQAGRNAPDNAGIFVQVPGGGDWTNSTLDIDDAPIQIFYSTTEQK